MNPILIVTGALYVVSLVVLAVSMWRAPEGYEDESGFHCGHPDLK